MKTMYCKLAISLIAGLTFSHRPFAQSVGPAPSGDPKKVATTVIKTAEHPCPRVTAAQRSEDGGIRASCSNGELYRVFSVQSNPVALRCSEARKLGVKGC